MEIQKYLETNENGNTKYQNLWDAARAVLREKLIAINTCIEKIERTQINILTLHLRELEKEQSKSKFRRRKEIIKIRTEISEPGNRKTIEENQWNQNKFFKKMRKIGKKKKLRLHGPRKKDTRWEVKEEIYYLP